VISALAERGCACPERQVFGAEIDPEAFSNLDSIIQRGGLADQFIQTDFLELQPADFGGPLFDVVIGNPPYVRHHDLKGTRREKAELFAEACNIAIPKRASYWAYFVAHCLTFIALGGRLALLLPSAFLFADYASDLRAEIVKRFRRTQIILLKERVFKDAQEKTVILLAEGFGLPSKGLQVTVTEDILELDRLTALCHAEPDEPFVMPDNWLGSLLSTRSQRMLKRLVSEPSIANLGQICDLSIGTVTGANNFFIVSPRLNEKLQIPEKWLKPIIGRSSLLRGLAFTENDWSEISEQGNHRCLVIDSGVDDSLPMALVDYLESGASLGIPGRFKCRHRHPWHQVPLTTCPPAFFVYMTAQKPRVVLNRSQAICTNSIYQVRWKESKSQDEAASIALCLLSSLSHLSAELEGRSYGGGVLKLEPSEAKRVLLVIPPGGFGWAKRQAGIVDDMIREGDVKGATQAVDEFVLRRFLGFKEADVRSLQEDLEMLVKTRLTPRQGNSDRVKGSCEKRARKKPRYNTR
jgi:hypothetical protein